MGHLARNTRLLVAVVIALFVGVGVAASAALPEDSLLVEHWDGSSWSEADAPSPGPSTLSAATAFSSSDVWAVGSSVKTVASGLRWHPLAEHYNGDSWTPTVLPNPARKAEADLAGVSGSSGKDVWAVGQLTEAKGPLPLIEHFDGTAWKAVQGARADDAALEGVAAVSQRNVWAVGYSGALSTKFRALVERWNGVAWRRIPTPKPRGSQELLLGVAASSGRNIWAVGAASSGRPLLLHWNGRGWKHAAGPALAHVGYLSGVTAIDANDIWAVGQEGSHPLAEHWNGRLWRVVPVQSPSGSSPFFSAVAAVSTNDVWAVGQAYENQGPVTLAEHWDGNSWQVVPTADRPGNPDLLAGVAAVSTGDVWAVGSSNAP